MNRRVAIVVGIVAIAAVALWMRGRNSETTEPEVELRTAEVTREDVVRSITATGVLRTYNIVDVKSKAGGHRQPDSGRCRRRGESGATAGAD
jgi:multidrug efflux pump subunit AcrA (membrane-fusion protein)